MEKAASGPAHGVARPEWATAALVVAALTALRLLWLAGDPVDLYGDEAQYWIWAKEPAFGYYSKPPLVAWLIAASTALFGDGVLAIKLPSALVHAGTAMVLWTIGRDLGGERVAFWSAVVWATLPAVFLSAVIISTDPPLLLCWALALHAFLRARRSDGIGWWVAAGVWTGFGLLAKYAMGYFIVSAALCLAATPGDRALLWRRLPALVLPALLLLAPNLVWNATNGFATFRHTGDNANLGGSLFHPGALAEFVASQLLVFGPITFAALVAAVATARGGDRRRLAFFVWPTLAVACVIAFLSRAHANWAAPAYVAATPLAVAWLLDRGRPRLLALAVALHAALGTVVMIGPATVRAAGFDLPARFDPWRRVSGWSELGEAVTRLRARHPAAGLLVDHRMLLAGLVYYVRPHPFDVIKWNPDGVANDHFELTTRLEAAPGRSFVLVTPRADPADVIARFDRAERLAEIVVPIGPDRDRRHHAFLLTGFRGYR